MIHTARCRSAMGRKAARLPLVALLIFTLTPQAQADEAQARGILKAMTDYLEGQESLSFDVDSSVDIVSSTGQKMTIASSGSIALQRPDRLHVIRQGGFARVDLVFDGSTLSVLNRDANVYGQAKLPGSVDQLVETLRDTYQRPLPAADFLGADVDTALLADVSEVIDLGSGLIRGMECDHLAFRATEVDWQIWVAQGDVPLPCRFVITSKGVEGWPEYTLEFSQWGGGQAKNAFTFEAPAGAIKADIIDVPNLDEVAGIFVVEKVD